jgi:hypothetical protein
VWSLRKIETNVRDPSRSGYRAARQLDDDG